MFSSRRQIERKSALGTPRGPSLPSVMHKHTIELAEFMTQKDLIENTEKIMLKLHGSRGNDLLDKEFKSTVESLKKNSQKQLTGTKDFLLKTSSSPFGGVDRSKPKFIELMLKSKQVEASQDQKDKSLGVSMASPTPRKAIGFDSRALKFFSRLKDTSFLKSTDPHIEAVAETSLSKGDMSAMLGALTEISSLLYNVFQKVSDPYEEIDSESLAIFMDLCRQKLQFLEQIYQQALQTALGLNLRLGQIENSGDSSTRQQSLSSHGGNMGSDVKYMVNALDSMYNYFNGKIDEYRGGPTKISQERLGELYDHFVDHKTVLQIKGQIKSFPGLVDKLEGLFEVWSNCLNQISLEKKKDQLEIGKLKTIIEEHRKTLENERKNFVDLQDQLKRQLGPDVAQIKKECEDTFSHVLSMYRSDVEKANQERDQLRNKVLDLESQVSKFAREELKRRSNTHDKAIQAIFQIGAAREQTHLLSDVINKPETAFSKGDPSAKTWLCSMVNFLLIQRLQFELENSLYYLEPKSMKDYILETFLARFGSAQATESILSDFVASLKKYVNESDRFRLFGKFLGIEESLGLEGTRKKKQNKFEDFLTNFYYTSHLAVRDFLEFSLLVRGFEYYEDPTHFRPYLGFNNYKRSQLIKVDIARKVFVNFVLNRENKSMLDAQSLEEEFDNLVKEDLYDRLHDKGKEMKTKNFKIEEGYVSFDFLAKYLLERRLSLFVNYLQKFASAITINSGTLGEKGLVFEHLSHCCKEMLPNIGDTLVAQIFREMADAPQLQSYSIEPMIQSTVKTIVTLKEHYQATKLPLLVITQEQYEDRNKLIAESEARFEIKVKKNFMKKEGSRILAYIEAISIWRDKHLLHASIPPTLPAWRLDNLTSLACVQECYEKLKTRIVFVEKSDDGVASMHIQLRDFFSSIPDKLVTRTSYDELKDQLPAELSRKIEEVWKQLRKVITGAFFHSQA